MCGGPKPFAASAAPGSATMMPRNASLACCCRARRHRLLACLLTVVLISMQARVFVRLAGLGTAVERQAHAVLAPFSGPGAGGVQWRPPPDDRDPREVRPFPRWGGKGIALRHLLAFLETTAARRRGNSTEHLLDAAARGRDEFRFPETLYVLDGDDLWVSSVHRKRNRMGKSNFVRYRVQPTERVMQLARDLLRADPARAKAMWPHLAAALAADGGAGFPFLLWYGDFKSCNYRNWNGTRSIPLFTTCGRVSCDYAWPIPTYRTIKDAHGTSEQWRAAMEAAARNYTWEGKRRAVVWRGGLTGQIDNYTSPRARLALYGRANRRETVLDIGLTRVPNNVQRVSQPDMRLLGGLADPISPMEDFQRYIGILDTDGNSWSSRFGKLLCYNSVVLKVEPKYVDYFHFKDLSPWIHYVPVRYDLSDLLGTAKFVTDPRNEHVVKTIVQNANQWCQKRMVYRSLARDMLDIWEQYVAFLNRADPHWTKLWLGAKARIFKGSDYKMTRIADALEGSFFPRLQSEAAGPAVDTG